MQYSRDLNNILEKAKKFAILLRRPNVCVDTLFHSLLQCKNHSLLSIFDSLNLKRSEFQLLSELIMVQKKESKNPTSRFSNHVKEILKIMEEASTSINEPAAPESLLFAILKYEKKPSVFVQLGRDFDFSAPVMERAWAFLIDKMPKKEREEPPVEVKTERQFLDMFEENKILNEFAQNLNLKAVNGDYDNLVNFEQDKIDEVVTTLLRRKKANVILVGDGGCGKSATVELLAKLIVTGGVSELFEDKVIYSVDLSRMIAGTEYRGQFEKRLTKFIEEAKKYENLILFFDEIHTLIGAGSGGRKNELEASNILKPALANGELSVIGATTFQEYEATFKADSALERRFHKIVISEPSKFKMREVLPQISSFYEREHDLVFSDSFYDYLIENCEKYLPNRRYPDKAIDILDTVGAKAKMKFQCSPDYVKKAQQDLLNISENIFSGQDKDESAIQNKIDEIRRACEKWEVDYISTPRVVDTDEIDNFFSKRKKLSLRGEFYKAADHLEGAKKEQVSSFLKSIENGPILFFGEKNSGKTTVCRAFLDFARKNEVDVINFSGLDFSITEFYKRILNSDCAVVVIDDLTEAHPDVLRFLCKVLKDKRIERTDGEIIDFTNVDFVLTCSAKKGSSMGFDKTGNNLEPNLSEDLCKILCNKLLLN